LLIRSGIQIADRTLSPLEQLGLGGRETVRGYRQDLLLTDNGVFASAEVQLPILRLPKLQSILQIIPFIDFGTGWNSSGMSSPNPSTLLSTGLGLQFQWGDRVTGRLDWGIPLISVDSKEKTLQEQGLFFSVIWRNSF
jgi:hemolysin activation/secretion protein